MDGCLAGTCTIRPDPIEPCDDANLLAQIKQAIREEPATALNRRKFAKHFSRMVY
jgi:hypothetical protein